MVTSITRQSILLKCQMKASIMLGNYEFYYGAGLFFHLMNHEPENIDSQPLVLGKELEPLLKNYQNQEERLDYLVHLLKHVDITEDYDEQMKELLLMGLNEKQLWQVHI